jgi:hypothetical protein
MLNGEVVQLLEPPGDYPRGGPLRVRCASLQVRTSFVLSPPSFYGLGQEQDVKGNVAQLLEPHRDSTHGGPLRVLCAVLLFRSW